MEHENPASRPAMYALRGVSRECPENTLVSIRTAICQGYDGVFLDVQVTADGVPVLCRNIDVSAMSYAEVSRIDAGEAFAHKYRGEMIPKLSDALALCNSAGLRAWLNMELVSRDRERDVFLAGEGCSYCFRDVQRLMDTASAMPEAQLAYCGKLDDVVLRQISSLGDRLTIWTDQPQLSFLPVGQTRLVVMGVDSYDRLDEVCSRYAPAAVCTSGVVKPDVRRGFRADVHMHSEYSQDSTCPISEICAVARDRDFDLVCITDHCDIRPGHDAVSLLAYRKQTVAGIREKAKNADLQVLVGVELGGGFLEPALADRMVAAEDYDSVIGSVHGIMFRGVRQSTANCDFGQMDMQTTLAYFDGYLDAMLYVAEKLDVDILAHLTYMLRYLNGKYKLDVDWRIREDGIRQILSSIIQRGIPLEINTSCRGGVYDEWLPAKEIVDLYLEMGGYLFTFGSDAHVSKRIGSYYDEVADYLRSKGVRYMIYFQKRLAHQYSI